MNTSPDSPIGKKDETKEGTDFKDKLAKFINPFYVSFVIFWVVCNYDFLLILIGKKAILHELYAHFGYGCSVLNITDDGKIYTNYQLNLFVCVEKSRLAYALYFAMWKVAIPLGLTKFYIQYLYKKVVTPLNLEYENTGKDVLRWIVNDEVDKKIKEIRDIDRKVTEEEMRVFAEINKHLDMDIERNEMDKQRQHLKTLDK